MLPVPPPGPGLVGWREWVSLPVLGVDAIKAKVDTGARTSALHAFELQRFDKNGLPWVRFGIHPVQRRDDIAVANEVPLLAEREIRSSNGERESRPVIRAVVAVGDHEHEIELSLTNRDEMGFRLLLGREALRGRYLVDPSRSYLSGISPDARRARSLTPKKEA